MRKMTFFLFGGAFAIALSGCATIERGAFAKVEVVTTPPGAHCKIYREGQGFLKAVATPGGKYIQRGDKPLTIVCEKSGYKTATITDSPRQTPDAEGSLGNFSNFGLGFLVDVSNRATYDVAERYEIRLERE